MSIDRARHASEPASANKTAESATLEQATTHVWGRLSPWSILHFVARAIVQILSNAIALVPLIVGLSRADSPLYVALGALFTLVAVVAYACLRYLNYWYQLDPDSVQVRQGIFTKAHLNLRFRRIQNVTIEHPFYFRPFGLVTVVIEGAGSAGEEVQLAALEVAVAEAIATTIRAHQTQATASTSDSQQAMQKETVILRRSLGDLVLHGLTNNRAWIILGGVAALYGQAANTINQQVLPALGIDVPGLAEGRSVIELGLLAIGVILLALVLMSTLSVLGSIVAFYGYTLIRTSEGFKVQRGLLTKHDVSVRRSRIQGIAVHRDWLDMMLGRMNVLYEQIAHAIGGQSLSIGKRITIPSVEPDHCAMLQAEALGIVGDLTRIDFVPANIRYWRRLALTTALPYVIVGSALSFSDAPWDHGRGYWYRRMAYTSF